LTFQVAIRMASATLRSVGVDAVVWSDYLCPWCYLGLDRTALLILFGVSVTPMPFELHPSLPAAGVPARGSVYDRIAAECAEVGLPFARPARVPNTRRAHETALAVRALAPASFDALHRSLFDAHFVSGLPIDDQAVLDSLVVAAGADADAVRSWEAHGEIETAREAAFDAGAAGAPAWLLDGRLLIPGVQPREHYERMVARMRRTTA
jgi:predicted DsbA family dithiol-disulfide isomerase